MREQFHNQKDELIAKYEEKMVQLREDLELRLKVEIHEIEERKDQHINDLMREHPSSSRR